MSDYQAFELKSGGCLERVERLCRHLTSGGKFTDNTPVSIGDVLMSLDDSYYFILGDLAKNGYDTTIAGTLTNVLAVLEQIQAYDAAAAIEFGMPVSDTGEPNERFKGMVARRDRLITDYVRGDALQQLGATRSRARSTFLEGTGRSIDRKNTVYDNSDVVPSRFPRGYGQRRDVPNRSGVNGGGADSGL